MRKSVVSSVWLMFILCLLPTTLAEARYYDPKTGRFLQEDKAPLVPDTPEGLNVYPYVSNNPTSFVDPEGLQNGVTTPSSPVMPETTVPPPPLLCPTLVSQNGTDLPEEGECRLLRVERGFGGRIAGCVYLCKINGTISELRMPPNSRGGCDPVLKRHE